MAEVALPLYDRCKLSHPSRAAFSLKLGKYFARIASRHRLVYVVAHGTQNVISCSDGTSGRPRC
jgi:hypothetical protein